MATREAKMILGVPGAVVQPGRPITLGARSLSADPFRPFRLIVSQPESWSVESLKISGAEQLAGPPLPAIIFDDAPPLQLQIILPGFEVELRLVNTSMDSRMVAAELRGWGP